MAADYSPVVPQQFQDADQQKMVSDIQSNMPSPVDTLIDTYNKTVLQPLYNQAKQAVDTAVSQTQKPLDQSQVAPPDQPTPQPTESPLDVAVGQAKSLGQQAISTVQSNIDTKDYSRQALESYARQRAKAYGVDPEIFVRQINQESGFSPYAKSGAGAEGVAQFMPETAKGIGLNNPFDPYESIDAMARYDSNLLQQFGSYDKMLAAYNAGGGAVQKYGGVPPYKETQTYVANILGGKSVPVSNQTYTASGQPIPVTSGALDAYHPPTSSDVTMPAALNPNVNPDIQRNLADQQATDANLRSTEDSLRQSAAMGGIYLPPIPSNGQNPDVKNEVQLMLDAEQHKIRTPIGPGGLGIYNPNIIPQVGNGAEEAFQSGMEALDKMFGETAGAVGRVIVGTGGVNDQGIPNNPLGVAGEGLNALTGGAFHPGEAKTVMDETGQPIAAEDQHAQVLQNRINESAQRQQQFNSMVKSGQPLVSQDMTSALNPYSQSVDPTVLTRLNIDKSLYEPSAQGISYGLAAQGKTIPEIDKTLQSLGIDTTMPISDQTTGTDPIPNELRDWLSTRIRAVNTSDIVRGAVPQMDSIDFWKNVEDKYGQYPTVDQALSSVEQEYPQQQADHILQAYDASGTQAIPLGAENQGVHPPTSAPQSMDMLGESRVSASFDPSYMRQMMRSQYGGAINKAIVKETVQNSVDASRSIRGAVTTVNVDSPNHEITVKDQGTGMLPAVLNKEFVQIGGSKKEAGVQSTGGMGTAKSAFLGNAQNFALRTVAKDPVSGNYIESVITGTGDQYIDPSQGMRRVSAIAGQLPQDVLQSLPPELQGEWPTVNGKPKTGTWISEKPLSDTYWSDSELAKWAHTFAIDNRLQGQRVDFNIDGHTSSTADRAPDLSNLPDWIRQGLGGTFDKAEDHLGTIDTPSATLQIYGTKGVQEADSTTAVLMNAGQPQASQWLHFGGKAKVPTKLVVDVIPKVGAGQSGYPWRPDRNGLIDTVSNPLEQWVKRDLVLAAQQKEHQQVTQALLGATEIPEYKKSASPAQGLRLLDTDGILTAKQKKTVVNHSYVPALSDALSKVHDLLNADSQGKIVYGKQVGSSDFYGLGVDKGWYGLNVYANPDIGLRNNQVMINPWTTLKAVVNRYGGMPTRENTTQFVEDFSSRLWGVLVHEIAHNGVRGHDFDHVGVVGELMAAIGRRRYLAAESYLYDRVLQIFADPKMFKEFFNDTNTIGNTDKSTGYLAKFADESAAEGGTGNTPGDVSGGNGGGGLAGGERVPTEDATGGIGPEAGIPNGSTVHQPTAADLGGSDRQPTIPGKQSFIRSIIDPRKRWNVTWAVKPLDSLVASQTDTLADNPDFPTSLQPRDRTRFVSANQVNQYTSMFAGDQYVEDQHTSNMGAPTVNPKNQVIAGNGRTLILRNLRQSNPKAWAEYQRNLAANADQFGIDAKQLQGIKDPVLVRVSTDSPAVQQQIANDSNAKSALEMSGGEQAVQDAKLISDDQLANLQIRDGETLGDALARAGNNDIVAKFVGALPVNDRGSVLSANGKYLSTAGLQRLKGAILAKAFNGVEGQSLVSFLADSNQAVVKRVESTLFSTMSKLAKAKGMLDSGARDPKMDAFEDIATALNKVLQLRRAKVNVKAYMDRPELIVSDYTPFQRQLITSLDKMVSSGPKLRTFLDNYADEVLKSPDPRMGSLFDMGPALSKEEMVNKALDAGNAANSYTRGSMESLASDVLAQANGTAEQRAALEARYGKEPGDERWVLLHSYRPDLRPYVEEAFQENGLFAGRRRGVESDTQAAQAAAEAASGMSIEQFLRTKPGQAFNNHEILMLGNALNHMNDQVTSLAQQVREARANNPAGAEELENKFANTVLTFNALASVFRGSQAEAGRSLRAFRQEMMGEYGLRMRATARAARAFGTDTNGKGRRNGTGDIGVGLPGTNGDVSGKPENPTPNPPETWEKPVLVNGKIRQGMFAKPTFTPEDVQSLGQIDKDLVNKAQSMYQNLGIDTILRKANGDIPGEGTALSADDQKALQLWQNFWDENKDRLLDIGTNVPKERMQVGEAGAPYFETQPKTTGEQGAMPGLEDNGNAVPNNPNGSTGEVSGWKWLRITPDGVLQQGSFFRDPETYQTKVGFNADDLEAAKNGEQLPLFEGNYHAGGYGVKKTADAAFAAIGTNRAAFDNWMNAWMMTDPTDYTQRYRLLSVLNKPSLMRYATAYNMANMLLSHHTFVIVASHGMINALNDPLIRAMRWHPDEAWHEAYGMYRSLGAAMSNGFTALTTGIHPSEAQSRIRRGELDTIHAEPFAGKMGMAITPASRVIGGIHEIARTMAAGGGEYLWAYRRSKETGRPMEDYLKAPPREMLDFAEKLADNASSGGEPSLIGKKLLEMRNLAYYQPDIQPDDTPMQIRAKQNATVPAHVIGYMMHIMFPFVRFPEFVLRNGLKVLTGPAYYPAMMAWHGAQAARNPLDASYHIDKLRGDATMLFVTSALMTLMYHEAQAGNITGSGPSSASQRAALEAATDDKGNHIWQAHSVRIGNRWVDYSSFGGPLAIPLAAVSSYVEQERYEKNKNVYQNPQPIIHGITGAMQAISDASYMRTYGDIIKAIQQGSGAAGALSSLGANAIERWIPYEAGLSQVERATDSGVKAPRSIPEQIAGRIPGLSHSVPNRVDVYGNDVKNSQDLLTTFSPAVTSSKGAPDPVSAEVARLDQSGYPVSVRYFSGQKAGESYEGAFQNPDQVRGLQQKYGQAAHQYLQSAINQPGYAALDDKQKAATLNAAITAANRAASIPSASIATRDPQHQAADMYASVPHYIGVSGTPDQIRAENLAISEAKAKLSAYQNKYGSVGGGVMLRKDDPHSYLLSMRGDVPPEVMKVFYNRIDKQTGGALSNAAAQGLVGTSSSFQGVP